MKNLFVLQYFDIFEKQIFSFGISRVAVNKDMRKNK